MRFAEGEIKVGGVIDCKRGSAEVEGVIREFEFLVEIQKLEVNIRADCFILCARFVEQFFGEISAGDLRAAFDIIVKEETQLPRAAADIQNIHARLRFEQVVGPHVNIGGAVFFVDVDSHQQIFAGFLIINFHASLLEGNAAIIPKALQNSANEF